MTSESDARAALAEVCRLSYQRGYICGTEGNFSIRLSQNVVLTTPRGTCKGKINSADLVLTDLDGNALTDGCKPSTELKMHLTAYKVREEMRAVCHAHPTAAVGFSVAGVSLAKSILPEVICTVGTIPTAPYATPSTDEIPGSIERLIKDYDAIVLDHHGALTVGSDIWDAFYKLETLEHHAQTLLVAHILGGPRVLPADKVKQLLAIRSVYGITGKVDEAVLISSREP